MFEVYSYLNILDIIFILRIAVKMLLTNATKKFNIITPTPKIQEDEVNSVIQEEYYEKGFVILRDFFPNDILSHYENTVVTLHYQQCLKLPEFHKFIGGGNCQVINRLTTLTVC